MPCDPFLARSLAACVWALSAAALLTACDEPAAPQGGCTDNKDCPAKHTCNQALCIPDGSWPCKAAPDCKTALSKGDWRPEGEATCREPVCQKGLCLLTESAGSCWIDATCYPQGAANPKLACSACLPDATKPGSARAWSQAPTDTVCKSGGPAGCTTGRCDSAGKCNEVMLLGQCLIDKACVPAGTRNANLPCTGCVPGEATDKWVNLPSAATCDSDTLACTLDHCDGKGGCVVGDVAPTSCLIEATCVPSGTANAKNDCQACDPTAKLTDWSPVVDGSPCQGAGACREATCGGGKCVGGKMKDDWCEIGGAGGTCVKGATLDPKNACQHCQPKLNVANWTPLAQDASCAADESVCTVDHCDGKGGCVHDPNDAVCADPSKPCATFTCGTKGCDKKAKAEGEKCVGEDGVACTVEICAGGDCAKVGTPDNKLCVDGFACTTDVCDPKAGCSNLPDGVSTCDDANACTLDECKAKQGCTHAPQSGIACDNDSLPCTVDLCQSGTCQKSVKLDACAIGGVCQKPAESSAFGCLVCDPGKAQDAWTAATSTTACTDDDKLPCTQDLCDGKGKCGHEKLAADTCLIAGVCQFKDAASAFGCLVCDPAKAPTQWTPANAQTKCSEDDKLVCTLDVCDGKGTCTHDQIAADTCLIGGECKTKGDKIAGGCQKCDPLNPKAWTKAAQGTKCDDEGVACSVDTCKDDGSCQHQPDDNLCDEAKDKGKEFACTDNLCNATLGCLYIDNCPYGHECDAGANACLSPVPVVVVSASGATDPFQPTNPALVTHKKADGKPGHMRTWVVYQTNTCATAVTGGWQIDKGAELRAVLLDPIVKPASEKKATADGWKSLTTVTLPKAKDWAVGATVCQGFPVVSGDAAVLAGGGLGWLSWLESDVGAVEPGGCLKGKAMGGRVRVASLSAMGAAVAQEDGCPALGSTSPLFMTQAFVMRDPVVGAKDAVAGRGWMTVRAFGGSLVEPFANLQVHGSPQVPSGPVKVGYGGDYARVHPVLVDTTKPGAARYVALAVTNKAGAHSLWAQPLADDGVDGTAETWLTAADGLKGVTAVCGVDAAWNGKTGEVGVVLVVRREGKSAVVLVRKGGGVATVVEVAADTVASTTCDKGFSTARVGVLPSGKYALVWRKQLGADALGEGSTAVVDGSLVATPKALASDGVWSTDSGAGALAWRGVGDVVGGAGDLATVVVEAQPKENVRAIQVLTFKP